MSVECGGWAALAPAIRKILIFLKYCWKIFRIFDKLHVCGMWGVSGSGSGYQGCRLPAVKPERAVALQILFSILSHQRTLDTLFFRSEHKRTSFFSWVCDNIAWETDKKNFFLVTGQYASWQKLCVGKLLRVWKWCPVWPHHHYFRLCFWPSIAPCNLW